MAEGIYVLSNSASHLIKCTVSIVNEYAELFCPVLYLYETTYARSYHMLVVHYD